ncbi:MAG: efflux RND transporter permease subunit [Bacteroidales bacterium]|nr:efflux RND transporter permease subunit [Bacteroidales bacterium]
MRGSSDIVKGAVLRKSIVYVIVLALVAIGIYGLKHMNKDEFPTFEIKQGLVAGIYPGASAREVESRLTEPLEKILFSFPEVKRENTTSVSKDGVCYIYVDVDVAPEQKSQTWSKIRLALNAQKMFLPAGVLAVAVLDDFSAVSSLLIALESSDKSWTEMKYYADRLSSRLQSIKELANVSVIGAQEEEIAVVLDQDRLAGYGISPASLMLEYQTSSLPLSGGTFRGAFVDVGGMVSGEQEVADMIVWSDPEGNSLRLRDIATVERRYKKPRSFVDYNGNTALVLSVEMRPDNNIVAFGEKVDKVLAEYSEELPDSVSMSRITDQPKVVQVSVMSFLRDLLISMLVVIFVMLMLFPMRSALIASSGVPVCTAVTIAVMYLAGIPLNTVTLAALIVVLGMIVDDSIITMDGYMDKIGKGLKPMEAAISSAKELFMPMFMATFAISAMFFPTKAIISGYLGDFIRYFPWVIAIALAASLVYAMLVVPSLEIRFIGTSVAERENFFTRIQHRFFSFLQNIYEWAEEKCFRYPKTTIFAGVVAVGSGIFMFTHLNVQMMPMAARDMFAIEVNLEAGNGLEDTRKVVDSLQRMLLSDERVKSVTSFVGTGAPRFHATYPPKTPSEKFAQIIVNTVSSKATESVLDQYEKTYEHLFPDALIRFKQMDYQGVTPIAVTFRGASVEDMKPYADSLKKFMYGMSEQLKWIHGDCDEYAIGIDVNLDADEAARLGVNRALASVSLSGILEGTNVATLWEEGTKIPVNLYYNMDDDPPYDELSNLPVPTLFSGTSVPLRQVASLTPSWEPAQIPHFSGEESVTVFADMKHGKSQPAAMKLIRRYVDSMIVPVLPDGVEVVYGGLSASNDVLIPEIGLSFLCAVLILIVFLVLHFKKISLSLLTIVLSLLCLFGAFFGLWLFDIDFSMTAVLGLISLVGIIVRNGIIMFEYAEELRFERGYDVRTAAMEAGKRRMRPIFLTSCTTAIGVLPMIISGDLLWLPMGVVICFGTLLSISLIVLVMPVSYWQLFRKEDVNSNLEG